MVEDSTLEFRTLYPELQAALAEFFKALAKGDDASYFHPHPFTAEEAQQRCAYQGKDLYYVAIDGQKVLGYGMLRGWDEGFAVPSLGIALHPNARGTGLGGAFMQVLHAAARLRGAKRVRLKVHPENSRAVRLYERLGYQYENEADGQLVGYLNL